MQNRSVNAFLLHVAKCLSHQGVTNHAIRQAYKQANLTSGDIAVPAKDMDSLGELVIGLATAYYELEK